ncbi:MAG TPA: hypothetical protein VFB39_11240 [Solirubrobacteraceae bacterium]|nr:hypothetical protein [Solirubrobacteraceae bacterium]
MLLEIYLNDHLAAATAGRDLARRAASSNRDSEYGPFLQRLAHEITEDRESLVSIMRALNVKVNRIKVLAGWGAEKVGRLKLNGRLLGYSPLSRLVELETLSLGVHGKLALWRSLQQLEPTLLPPGYGLLPELVDRAQHQLEELEVHRQRASTTALTSD